MSRKPLAPESSICPIDRKQCSQPEPARAGRTGVQPALAALDHASEGYPMLVLLIVLFIVGLTLGSVLLLIGLRRARRVPIWAVAAVVFVVCGSTGGVVAGGLGILAALAAFVPVALVVGRPFEGGPGAWTSRITNRTRVGRRSSTPE
ncbi:hypothetical protein FGL98_19400 [Leekyejoonella antrihumi]|uniref:Uncharacterized protein n=1 Tax=Leekyejoonella antrihumi TaxID=1660198 RepID=A0A563DV92_9MICO|nr:hypothetical protein FGL98_19400 [Leekyejoonella antrihumi]